MCLSHHCLDLVLRHFVHIVNSFVQFIDRYLLIIAGVKTNEHVSTHGFFLSQSTSHNGALESFVTFLCVKQSTTVLVDQGENFCSAHFKEVSLLGRAIGRGIRTGPVFARAIIVVIAIVIHAVVVIAVVVFAIVVIDVVVFAIVVVVVVVFAIVFAAVVVVVVVFAAVVVVVAAAVVVVVAAAVVVVVVVFAAVVVVVVVVAALAVAAVHVA